MRSRNLKPIIQGVSTEPTFIIMFSFLGRRGRWVRFEHPQFKKKRLWKKILKETREWVGGPDKNWREEMRSAKQLLHNQAPFPGNRGRYFQQDSNELNSLLSFCFVATFQRLSQVPQEDKNTKNDQTDFSEQDFWQTISKLWKGRTKVANVQPKWVNPSLW